MGFPVGYTELLFPKLLLLTLSVLGFIRKMISSLFKSLGLGDFLEPDIALPAQPDCAALEPRSLSAILIRELLPVVKFSDLVDPPESCAVCLYEFDGATRSGSCPTAATSSTGAASTGGWTTTSRPARFVGPGSCPMTWWRG
ncbi:hypothetical protein C3L33_08535, partial [Rhododendron williamsianum]